MPGSWATRASSASSSSRARPRSTRRAERAGRDGPSAAGGRGALRDVALGLLGLRALYVNCTLKRSPEVSHTQGLADLSMAIMQRTGVSVEVVRAVDHHIATGVWPDMTVHGWERDDWPAIFEQVMADILVLLSPIWLGEKSSVCTLVIERLYGNSHLVNDAGQYAYYGRAAAAW